MKSFSKRYWVVGALLVAFTAGQSRPAHALVGLSSANPAVALAGAVTAGAAVAFTSGILLTTCSIGALAALATGGNSEAARGACNLASIAPTYFSAFLSVPVFVIGIGILPASGGSVQLPPLNAAARELLTERGVLSSEQLIAFEDERQELEAIAQDVGQALLTRASVKTSSAGAIPEETLVSWSRQEWLARRTLVSEEAFEAMALVAEFSLLGRTAQ